jgi:hypothetical protein
MSTCSIGPGKLVTGQVEDHAGGKVKILDFGQPKAVDTTAPARVLSNSSMKTMCKYPSAASLREIGALTPRGLCLVWRPPGQCLARRVTHETGPELRR